MKRILFIEDEIITGSIYKRHLTAAGYQVQLADDGKKGIEALRGFNPDIVILDLMLPRISGLEILRHIRSQPDTTSLPVIVFSNAYAPEMMNDAEKAGANLCLIKAKTSADELVTAVRENLATPASEPANPVSAAAVPLDPGAEFLKGTPPMLANLRGLSQNLLKASSEAARVPIVLDLYRGVHELTAKAALAKAPLFAQMASAFEVLLKELDEKPEKIDASSMRTVNQSVDFLDVLFKNAPSRVQDKPIDFKILAVDDEVFSRKAVAIALERAGLKSVNLDDPLAALELLKKEPFDLVITDVKMPGMDGFGLCEKLRALSGHASTPVIFVTALNGFEARVRSARSGGDDFIAKPFLHVELAVKALTHALRRQLKAVSPSFQAFQPKSR